MKQKPKNKKRNKGNVQITSDKNEILIFPLYQERRRRSSIKKPSKAIHHTYIMSTSTPTTNVLRTPALLESIALGGTACVFTVNFTHPIELVKTRMQVSGNTIGTTISSTLSKEGIGAFWKGIAWAWGREGSYASIKLGAYAPVRDAIGAGNKDCKFIYYYFKVSVCCLCFFFFFASVV
jgi:hypothetical protein